MKKFIIIFSIVVFLVILAALIFDWGRRGSDVQVDIQKVLIRVDLPKENQELKSPIKISGQARGNWFFEGSFPIQLVDTNGDVLATGIATSTEDWMTEDFIPFFATLEFIKPTSTKHALIILKKDNPSDLRELDDSISIPVLLK